jgi:translation elongation factor EF-Ts
MDSLSDLIFRLREDTKFKHGLMDCKMALKRNGGDMEKAKKYLEEDEKMTLGRLITIRSDVNEKTI